MRSGLDLIQFSLDADDGVTNDKIRARSSFARILGNIRLLAEANRRAGMPLKICITTIQFKTRDQVSSDCAAPVPGWLRDARRDFPEITFVPAWATPWPAWRPDARFEIVADPAPYTPPKSCSSIDETLTIRADGTVVACCYDLLSKSDLGNVMEQDLSEIWNGAHAEFSGRFANGDFPSPCNTCTQVSGRRYLVIKNPTSLTFPV